MTTRQSGSFLRRLDPRALPIAVKLASGLIAVLVVSGFITTRALQQVVRDNQVGVVLNDLETLSRSNAFRMADLLGQEVVTLSRFGASTLVQDGLNRILSEMVALPPAPDDYLLPDPVLADQVIAFRQTHGEFDAVVILDAEGKVRGIDPIPSIPPERARNPVNETWFTNAYHNGEGATNITSPEDDHLTGFTGIQIAVPIYDTTDPTRVLGIVYAVWNMSNVLDITQVGLGREAIVLEPDGTVLIASANAPGTSYPSELTRRFAETPTGSSFLYTDRSGREWLYGFVSLHGLGIGDETITRLRWTIATRLPADAIGGNVALLTRRLQITVGLVALSITIAVGVLATLFLYPLRRLTDAATRLHHGDLSVPIPELPADEVGQLASIMRDLVARLLERLDELRAAVQISQAASLTLDIQEMLGDVTRALTEQFGYPDARIYLVDAASQRAVIQAASGGEGERLLRTGHRIPIDEKTLVGRALLLGEHQIGAQREQLRQAGLLTGNSELVIPFQSGPRPLGALHVLARRLGEFEPEDVGILRLIADQVTASITNARLLEQSAASLAEIETLNRRLTREAWEDFVSETGSVRHTLDPQERWPTALDTIMHADQIRAETYLDDHGRSVLAAPLVLRGEAVGTLAVTRPGGERWSSDEISLIESVAARMAMVAESIRLVDETSRRAVREQRVNEVSANLLQRATNVDSVLRAALGELGGALGSERVSLRLGSAPGDTEQDLSTARLLDLRPTSENGGSTDGTDGKNADSNGEVNDV